MSARHVFWKHWGKSGFYPFRKLSDILIKFEIVVCKHLEFGRVKNLSFGRQLTKETSVLFVCLGFSAVSRVLQLFNSDSSQIHFSWTIFSWPEHKVLRMSYCNQSLSVRQYVRPSKNNYLRNLLLWNRATDFNETSQKWSLGDALSEHFKDMNSMKNSGCHGNRKKKL